ncbi:MAG: hypothetical protein M1818_000292 [Claussenomyces sp. TS43310]|nr:MAG: hypothetical protein M1818_000292 [Claussenomyces sp. TS43310]
MVSPTPTRSPTPSPKPRKALHERSNSQTNVDAAIRLVPYEPSRLENRRDEIYARTPLPTSSAHVFPPATSASYRAYEGLQGLPLTRSHEKGDVSSEPHPTKSLVTSGPESSAVHQPSQVPQTPQSRSRSFPSSSRPPSRKLRKQVAVDPQTKTFKVLDAVQHEDELEVPSDEAGPIVSPTGQQSQDQVSLETHSTEDPAESSTASWFPESTIISTPASSIVSRNSLGAEDSVVNSPWNYTLVGGLRKVPKTPDQKQRPPDISEYPLPPLPESPVLGSSNVDAEETVSLPPLQEASEAMDRVYDLSTKPSFRSTMTESTSSDDTNYKVYREASPPPSLPPSSSSESNSKVPYTSSAIPPPSSSNSNYQVLGTSPSISQLSDHSNYQILNLSPTTSEAAFETTRSESLADISRSTSNAGVSSSIRPTYSQESLIVPPLRPRAKESLENLGHNKSYSKDSFRTGSFTSLSTVFSQEAAEARVASGSIVSLPRPKYSSIWTNSNATNATRFSMQAHPHVWSSQLSTVASESDGGTDRGSRAWSDAARSSGALSPASHRMPSISSSMMLAEGHSFVESVEPPQPVYARTGQRDITGSIVRMVEDQDEYGDGITDMPGDLRSRPSRRRLSFFSTASSDNGRSNTIKSTTSSRSNSLLASSIPAWARLYYSSGERRYLEAPASSTEGTDSRPQTSIRSGSPDMTNLPLRIYSPRRRPREIGQDTAQQQTRGSMEISPLPARRDGSVIHSSYTRTRRIRTPSIWSPHLQRDRRSTRNSLWDPPSVSWSTEPGLLGRRNIQLVLFIAGFIFPFAWMIAAFLPLPPAPNSAMHDSERKTTECENPYVVARELGPMDEARYESARWWRNLNRGMAVLGFLIIITIDQALTKM